LAVERFDRGAHGERIHMEDFAQVFGLFPESKYDKRSYANIAAVLWAESGDAAAYEFVRRLVFSIMIGNADMHLKNWSILYPDKRTPVPSLHGKRWIKKSCYQRISRRALIPTFSNSPSDDRNPDAHIILYENEKLAAFISGAFKYYCYPY
jgi:hypothetical protein